MKVYILLLITLILNIQLFADSISGQVIFLTKGTKKVEKSSVIIGDPDYGVHHGFPEYLSAFFSSYSDEKKHLVSPDGKFFFDGISAGNNKMLIFNHQKFTYFKKVPASQTLPYVWNEEIDLPSENLRSFKIKVHNQVTGVFPLTYLIEDGNEGWTFSGKRNRADMTIEFNDIPDGIYNFVALTSAGDDKPNRVDSFRIEVSDSMPNEITVVLKGKVGNTLIGASDNSEAVERIKKPSHSDEVKPFKNQPAKITAQESTSKADKPTFLPWWLIGIVGLAVVMGFMLLKGRSK